MAGCGYCQIKDLTLNASQFYINTLIIAKTERKVAMPGRAVITFTVRDTKEHFINCSVWGSEKFIETCTRTYKIGDLVSIFNPTVQQKNNNSVYNPRTTSPFELVVNESKAYIHRTNEHSELLLQLRRQAIKPTSLALKLNDLHFYPDSNAVSLDVVVLVKFIEPPRQVQTRFGPKTTRKVYLMDMTMESMPMTVWHPDYQERIHNQWLPLQTVLHLVDVKAEYSSFERSTTLSITSKTIIIEDPVHSSRVNEILVYIHSLDQDKYNELKNVQQKSAINAASIKDVMTVKRILDRIERDPTREIAAVVYGVFSKFDINAGLVKSCVHCKRLLWKSNDCGTVSCAEALTNGPRYIDKVFMPISVTDHSGTLNCRITDESAHAILGHTAQQLKELSEDDIDAIYNKFILERFAVKMIIRPKSSTDYFANILSVETESAYDMALALKP